MGTLRNKKDQIMRRLWLIFAQAVTLSLAVLFVVQTLKQEWLGRGGPAHNSVVAVQQAVPADGSKRDVVSYSNAAQKALPSVVHIFTSQEVKAPVNPLLN